MKIGISLIGVENDVNNYFFQYAFHLFQTLVKTAQKEDIIIFYDNNLLKEQKIFQVPGIQYVFVEQPTGALLCAQPF